MELGAIAPAMAIQGLRRRWEHSTWSTTMKSWRSANAVRCVAWGGSIPYRQGWRCVTQRDILHEEEKSHKERSRKYFLESLSDVYDSIAIGHEVVR